MSSPLKWDQNDAGFEPGTFNNKTARVVKKPNAQVSALAIFKSELLGRTVTYADMYAELTDAMDEWTWRSGRRTKQRAFWQQHTPTLHQIRMPKEFYKPFIEALPVVWVPTNWIGVQTKLHLDENVFDSSATVLARASADELIPIIRGEAQYPWDPNNRYGVTGTTRMVYGYWTTP